MMNIEKKLKDYKKGKISHEKILKDLKNLPYEDFGTLKIDHHRQIRKNHPEVVYGENKTFEDLDKAIRAIKNKVMITRLDEKKFIQLKKTHKKLRYDKKARIAYLTDTIPTKEGILILTAGTTDIPVAEEAKTTAQLLGQKPKEIYDVGVAGVHRLLAHKKEIFEAKVIIVIAGMEAALASVVAGLANCPIIAVPTSIGYGASFKGLNALLSMMNTCSPGVAVVNIDNGFGAGYMASLINK